MKTFKPRHADSRLTEGGGYPPVVSRASFGATEKRSVWANLMCPMAGLQEFIRNTCPLSAIVTLATSYHGKECARKRTA